MGTLIVGQREIRGDGFGSGLSRDGYWTHSSSTLDVGRSLNQSQLKPLQAMYGVEDRRQGDATRQSLLLHPLF